jgi:hypothetical protein
MDTLFLRPAIDDELLPVAQLRRLAGSLGADLYNAVRYYETFLPSARASPLMDRINEARIHSGLMAVSDALYEGAVLALARLWDSHPNVATLIAAAELVKRRNVRAAFEAAGIPIDVRELKAWRQDLEIVKASSQLREIRKARNRALAHSEDPNRNGDNTPVRMALYENDIWVLDRTMTIFDRFNTWVGFGAKDGSFSDRRLRVSADAARFWEHVAPCGNSTTPAIRGAQ